MIVVVVGWIVLVSIVVSHSPRATEATAVETLYRDEAWIPVISIPFPATSRPSSRLDASNKSKKTKNTKKKSKKTKKALKKKPKWARKAKKRVNRIPPWMDGLDGTMDNRLRNGWESGSTVDVIVIDSGCNRNPRSFIPNDSRPAADDAGHSSKIVAILDLLVPFANVTCFKVFDASGRTSDFDRIVRALEAVGPYCARKRKCFVNLSIQMSRADGKVDRTVRELIANHNVTVVTAAGNWVDGTGKIDFTYHHDACNFSPSGAGGGVAVAGATSATTRIVAPFSRIGSCVTEFAPGWKIRVGNKFLDGTSFATPIVLARHVLSYELDFYGFFQTVEGFDPLLVKTYSQLVNVTTRNYSLFI